jgi:lipoprotein-anchoring transpeptidase ErfK/SrfK
MARRRVVVAATFVLGLAILRIGCGSSDGSVFGARWVATATVPEVAAYAEPGDSKPTHRLANPDQNGGVLVFLVHGRNASGTWLPVYLPVRPNGTKGWIRARDVTLSQTRYEISVDLSAHTLRIAHDGSVTLQAKVGLGEEDTPTPGGTYYIKELIEPPNPHTLYGPYVFGLSGYSNTLSSFRGQGDGVIGIHGTNDETSIGENVSSGCIRLHNDIITNMAEYIPLGTPVDITP